MATSGVIAQGDGSMGLFTAFSAIGKGADGKLLATILRELQKPLLAYEVVTASISPIAKVVPHRLGRTPMGWIVVDISAPTKVWRDAWDSSSITLSMELPTNITLLIF